MIKDFKYYVEWACITWFGIVQSKKYCPLWNAKLNELLDKYENDAKIGMYMMRLGESDVWIGNRFYHYGILYSPPNMPQKRPSLKTMIRLAKLQDKHAENIYRRRLGGII